MPLDFSTLYPAVLDIKDYNCCSEELSLSDDVGYPVQQYSITEERCSEEYRRVRHGRDILTMHSADSALERAASTEEGSGRRRKSVQIILPNQHSIRRPRTLESNSDSLSPSRGSSRVKFDKFYALTRQVQKGFSSTLWECKDLQTGAPYSVKIMERKKLVKAHIPAVYNESEILEHLRTRPHSGVLRIVDFFAEERHFYLVTEPLGESKSLLNYVRTQQQSLSEGEVRSFAISLLKAIRHLHSRNVVHRDLNPESILISGDEIKIGDFGFAARMQVGSKANPLNISEKAGARNFCAPEVLKGAPFDTQADMWSVGAIIYYLVGGRPPFVETQSRSNLTKTIIIGEYEFPAEEWAGKSQAAKDFVIALMQLDPDARLTSYEALDHPWLQPMETPVETAENTPIQPRKRSSSLRRSKNSKGEKRTFARVKLNTLLGNKNKVERRGSEVDDSKSTCSRTVSMASSDVLHESSSDSKFFRSDTI